MILYNHQYEVLASTRNENRVAYYLDMGLGKTFVGAEKADSFDVKILLICQKSKIADWMEHFKKYYRLTIFDLTNKKQLDEYILTVGKCVGVINYELAWRRKELLNLDGFTLMLDESSLIQNDTAKQSKFVLKLKPANVILLSGTPTSGKYENLWTQARLLGWDISKRTYESQYINYDLVDFGAGVKVRVVNKRQPYKNVERLKRKLREHGAVFMKTEEVINLPQQTFIPVMVKKPKEYKRFMEDSVVTIDDFELIATTALTKRLYARQIVGGFNSHKLASVKDLIESTNDRLIIFYNFNLELHKLMCICESLKRPISVVNGDMKDLTHYEEYDDSVTLVQYQAGAMGLNLQKANKIVYFSLPERSELFEQSKKRIHRIGQEKPCFYYLMMAKNSVDEAIYKALEQRKDFTDELFREIDNGRRKEPRNKIEKMA